MKATFKNVKNLLKSKGRKITATDSVMNGKRCYAVSGWDGEYTLDGIVWQLGK
ncbi:hypothetical protein [Pectobacterium carotovorum]|uniref:hypothetical protein n=1 Tax=Pectobacterium carotovorum TaxID=554 RepID=UPI00381D0180